jgi:hypothetical protein
VHNRINPDIDIVGYILEAVLKARPEDDFCISLQRQYAERGGLSKKQLEGLQGKAARIPGIHPGRMATLEAIIKKKHVTHRSTVTLTPAGAEKDILSGEMISGILEKYPGHKRVLFFKNKYDKDGILPAVEKAELGKFYALLVKK